MSSTAPAPLAPLSIESSEEIFGKSKGKGKGEKRRPHLGLLRMFRCGHDHPTSHYHYMHTELTDRVVMLTGASGGLGSEAV